MDDFDLTSLTGRIVFWTVLVVCCVFFGVLSWMGY